jgi:hypothetical protein
MGERISVYRVLVDKPGGKRPHGRPRRKWHDNIKCIFKMWNGGMDWMAQNRDRGRALVNAVTNLRGQ